MRAIEIVTCDEFHDKISEKHNHALMNACLGYLCLWGNNSKSYCFLYVHCDKDGSLNASYYDKPRHLAEKPTYFMYGHMSDDGTYSTHS